MQQRRQPQKHVGLILRVVTVKRLFSIGQPVALEVSVAKPLNYGIDYSVVSSTDVMKVMYSKKTSYDLIISSAMDLQVKLANDGFAKTYKPNIDITIPSWSIWNNMIFGFTQEPAAIVISKTAFKHDHFPRTRQELINKLRENPDRFKRRMGFMI